MELGHGLRLAVIFFFFFSFCFLFLEVLVENTRKLKKQKKMRHIEKSSLIESFLCCQTCHADGEKTLNLKATKSSVRYLH